jgi:hypothetical protein
MKVYNVYHHYDVDGGFGDAIGKSVLVATFESEVDANAFVEKYHSPYVYDRPYASLYCNSLSVSEMEIITHAEFDINKTPDSYGTTWWGSGEALDPYDDYDDDEEV